jgi:hypothetical protein
VFQEYSKRDTVAPGQAQSPNPKKVMEPARLEKRSSWEEESRAKKE